MTILLIIIDYILVYLQLMAKWIFGNVVILLWLFWKSQLKTIQKQYISETYTLQSITCVLYSMNATWMYYICHI